MNRNIIGLLLICLSTVSCVNDSPRPEIRQNEIPGVTILATDLIGLDDTATAYLPDRKAFVGQIAEDYNLRWRPIKNRLALFCEGSGYRYKGIVLRFIGSIDIMESLTLHAQESFYGNETTLVLTDCVKGYSTHPNAIDDDHDGLVDEQDESLYVTVLIVLKEPYFSVAHIYDLTSLKPTRLEFQDGQGNCFRDSITTETNGVIAIPLSCDSLGNTQGQYPQFVATDLNFTLGRNQTGRFFIRPSWPVELEGLRLGIQSSANRNSINMFAITDGPPEDGEMRVYRSNDSTQVFECQIGPNILHKDSSESYEKLQYLVGTFVAQYNWYVHVLDTGSYRLNFN